jgi:nickel transport protein
MLSTRSLIVIATALNGFTASALAHTVWLEPVEQSTADYRVLFGGHAGKLESYNPQKLKSVEATDKQGKKLTVTQKVAADGVRVHVAGGAPVLIAMHFDNGIHTRTESGPSVEKPMNEVPGAKRATAAVKYSKMIVAWSPLATQALQQPFEVVPLDTTPPASGKPMRVRVLQDGKPVAGVKLGRGEEGTAQDPVTDANGIAAFVPRSGFNKLWAGKRIPVSGNPQYTELSYEYLLAFNAQ